ncbi:hypothetical protein DAETH_38480 (plasmid) [Deinococcus aetherius]|uniref:Uncharacterized protein n=1 Tax=Deinococcus aetherius TaxID=200252 RepID=A0ABM8AJA1_9DEIO|nr:hypothetical protein [Deinococcus aetherius]BDP43879.1 hypothetical protein DAETH_38480 [Deinococcus aetherius]
MQHMTSLRPHTTRALTLGALLLAGAVGTAHAQDSDTRPAPASIGADIPATYFGPAPSQTQKELVGPLQLLRSGTVDQEKGTITLPLYRGQMRDGRNVWYVLTDTTDRGNADALGLNYSAKLTYGNVGRAARNATLGRDGTLTFASGTVSFAPEHVLTPGAAPNFFPPRAFKAGAVGDANYSPLVRIENAGGHIYNAPVVAFGNSAGELTRFCRGNVDHRLVHDKVVSICPEGKSGGTVTLQLTPGFSFSKPVLYLSLDASDELPAAMENVTLAPGMKDLPVGGDDGVFSAVERLFAAVNGPTGKQNPQRQGFNSALGDAGVPGPLNVLGGIPTVATDYSPMWDLNVYEWTPTAIQAGYRSRMIEEFQILGMAQRGFITGPGGARFGSTGFVVNCPIVLRFL